MFEIHFTTQAYVVRKKTKLLRSRPSKHYLFKDNNRNTRKRCEICSKLTVKTPERCQ